MNHIHTHKLTHTHTWHAAATKTT